MFLFFEIDSFPDDGIVISVIQISYDGAGLPVCLHRVSLPVGRKQIEDSFNYRNGLQIYVEYDQDVAHRFGVLRVAGLGFCTAEYRPSNDEILEIYKIPDLINHNMNMKLAYPNF